MYFDVDIIVVKNIDDFFKCGKFCVNLKYFERFNFGVLVVELFEVFFKDMLRKIRILFFYIGGSVIYLFIIYLLGIEVFGNFLCNL